MERYRSHELANVHNERNGGHSGEYCYHKPEGRGHYFEADPTISGFRERAGQRGCDLVRRWRSRWKLYSWNHNNRRALYTPDFRGNPQDQGTEQCRPNPDCTFLRICDELFRNGDLPERQWPHWTES